MSGFRGISSVVKTALNPVKAFKLSLNPMKNLQQSLSPIGDLTGANAAEDQAAAIREQTEQQQKVFAAQQQQALNENTLNSQNDLSNVANVSAGGTAADADNALASASKKNRRNLISTTLGI